MMLPHKGGIVSLWDRLFGKPGPREIEINDVPWCSKEGTVRRLISYRGLSDDGEASRLSIELDCEFLDGEPVLLMVILWEPQLLIDKDGYSVARCSSKAGDTGYFPVSLEQKPAGFTMIGFPENAHVRAVVERLMDGHQVELWVGSPTDALFCIPIPYCPLLSGALERGWAWKEIHGSEHR